MLGQIYIYQFVSVHFSALTTSYFFSCICVVRTITSQRNKPDTISHQPTRKESLSRKRLSDREITCYALDRQVSNFKCCIWRAVKSYSSNDDQEVILAQLNSFIQSIIYSLILVCIYLLFIHHPFMHTFIQKCSITFFVPGFYDEPGTYNVTGEMESGIYMTSICRPQNPITSKGNSPS